MAYEEEWAGVPDALITTTLRCRGKPRRFESVYNSLTAKYQRNHCK